MRGQGGGSHLGAAGAPGPRRRVPPAFCPRASPARGGSLRVGDPHWPTRKKKAPGPVEIVPKPSGVKTKSSRENKEQRYGRKKISPKEVRYFGMLKEFNICI